MSNFVPLFIKTVQSISLYRTHVYTQSGIARVFLTVFSTLEYNNVYSKSTQYLHWCTTQQIWARADFLPLHTFCIEKLFALSVKSKNSTSEHNVTSRPRFNRIFYLLVQIVPAQALSLRSQLQASGSTFNPSLWFQLQPQPRTYPRPYLRPWPRPWQLPQPFYEITQCAAVEGSVTCTVFKNHFYKKLSSNYSYKAPL